MNKRYVPILRWKSGEKTCLERLTEEISNQITPFVEVPTPSDSQTEEAAEKKYNKLLTSFNEIWAEKPFYLYLTDDWYDNLDSTEQITNIYKNFFDSIKHPLAIPSFNVSDELNIENISKLSPDFRVCLRISGNEFEYLSSTLDYYIRNGWIVPQKTDLLFDLKYIDEDIYPKKAALTTAIADVTNISEYNSIIISSCSFPKEISSLKTDMVSEFPRYENKINDVAKKLQKAFLFNYIYSDYGPMNLNDTPFVIGMTPNFKIKYTTKDKYLVVKGISLKKGGLDLMNVAKCCKLIYKHADFSGEAFSYGDKVIADTANGIAIKSGNLTNWVGYSLNHHITLICGSMKVFL